MSRKLDPKEDPNSIGNILVELGFCSMEDVMSAAKELDRIREETRDLRIGRILVDRGKITDAELEVALAKQEARKNGGRIQHASMTRVLQCAMKRHTEVDDSVDKMTQAAGLVLAKANGG